MLWCRFLNTLYKWNGTSVILQYYQNCKCFQPLLFCTLQISKWLFIYILYEYVIIYCILLTFVVKLRYLVTNRRKTFSVSRVLNFVKDILKGWITEPTCPRQTVGGRDFCQTTTHRSLDLANSFKFSLDSRICEIWVYFTNVKAIQIMTSLLGTNCLSVHRLLKVLTI